MKCAIACSLLLAAGALSLLADEFPPERKLVECSPRAGLPNFFAKLEKGGEVRVAYLGGSITEQQGWRLKSLAYFQKLYPNAKLKEINAAIGGTGSDLGVLRIEHDVFKEKPDLLFVEFAVNDDGRKPQDIEKAMEGIVRKTWKTFPDCDICFVYTLTSSPSTLDVMKAGKFNRSSATMEVVADHYAIPSIHMGVEVVRLEKEGKLIMKSPDTTVKAVSGDSLNESTKAAVGADGKIPFSPEGVHPYLNTGHQLYEEAIERSMALIKPVSKETGAHKLGEPLDPKNYEKSVMLQADGAQLDGSWTKLPATEGLGKQFSKRVDSLWKGAPGATLSFKFKGSRVLIYHLYGPGCGKLEITLDGKTSTTKAIDGYCTYYRLALLNLGSGLDPEKVHEVSVKVLPDKLDKAKILFERNLDDLKKNPAKYEPSDWYVGALFVEGELVK